MQTQTQHIGGPGIAYSIGWHHEQLLEELIAENMLLHIISGEMRLFESGSDRIYRAGETVLIGRNHLVKCGSRPLPGGIPYEIIVFILDRKLLEDYVLKYGLNEEAKGSPAASGITLLSPSAELNSLFDSLETYRKSAKPLADAIRRHKLEEAILALLEQGNEIAGMLFDFAEPGKTDLKAFMLRNYMFNIPVSKFAALTGRSVSTFQRDFIKIFGVKASVWLIRRRLEQAHQLLEQGRRPAEIYLEVGFGDISHFSRAFKKDFGYTPSSMRRTS